MTSPRWLICWKTLIHTTPALEIDQTNQFIQIFLVDLKIASGSSRILGKKIRASCTNLRAYSKYFFNPFGLFSYILVSIEVAGPYRLILSCDLASASATTGADRYIFLNALLWLFVLKAVIAADAIPIGNNRERLNIERLFLSQFII